MSGRGRGRRAKVTTTIVPVEGNILEDVQPVAAPEAAAPEVKVPAKRGAKKKFSVVAVVTPNGIEGSLQPEARKPLIAHLPIQSKDIIFHDTPIQYNPVPPTNVEPYDAATDDPFSESVETLQGSASIGSSILAAFNNTGPSSSSSSSSSPVAAPITQPAVALTTDVPDYYKKGTLLVQYQNSEETKSLPERVDIACFWCCHRFDNKPVILPVRDQGEYIQVQGNYCSPECAMAYLFDMQQDFYARWEQLSLLNRLYGPAVGGSIKPAPSRQILKMFGGPMSIEEYRGLVRQGKLRVDIHLPPMVSLLATMDTKPIDFYDVSLTKNVMETVKERLAKAEEVLKLKRTKPLKAWESTLDACINLKVRSN
jgi:hypothetical protein